MESRDDIPEHVPGARPDDFGYRVVVRTVLWAIMGLVFLGLAVWWVLT